MKATVATAVFLLVASFFCCLFGSSLAQSEQQRQALENVDVDNILRNEKLVHRHIACVLDNGRCDTNGRDLKDILPRYLRQGCSDCSPKQRDNADKIVDFMKKNHASDWVQINAKYGNP